MLEEIQFRRSFVYREGCKFVYDSGDLPDSLVGVAPGTVLALRRPHGITATQMPGKAEDWIVIGSGEGGSIPQIVDEDLDEVSTNAVQNKVIKEALDSKVSTVAQNYTDRQKENARTNIGAQEDIASMDDVQPINAALNDRAAVSANVDGVSKLRSMGYKVLKAPDAGDITTSFQRQLAPIVDGTAQPITNTVFEVKDYFDLGNETFTMPANSKLKIVGGKIDNGTLNLNKCQIEATNGWIGENLIISGNTSSDVYADWFQGSDADMIELAIQQFANVKLYPRIYTINRPIVIGNNFSLIGSSIGDFFGANGEGNTIGATATQLKPINNTLHCLLDVRGSNADQNSSTHPIHLPKRSKTKARYISASIMGVAFMSNVTSVGGVTDGIWWSTPGGPSRPINIVNCTFKGLRHGIDIFRDNVDSGIQTTNFGDSYFQQCVFASNIWGIYVEGTQSVSNMVMQSCVMEDNHHYNGYETGGGIYSASNGTFCGNLRLRDNLFEGQRYGVVIKGMDLNVEFSGNYFEWKNGQNNVLYNNNTNSTRKAKLILDIDTVTHASKTRFDIRGFEVEQRQYSGLSYLINNYFNECLLKNNISLDGRVYLANNMDWVAVPATKEFLSKSNVRDNALPLAYTMTPTKIFDGICEPFFCRDDFGSKNGMYVGRTLDAGTYRLCFYCKGALTIRIGINQPITGAFDDHFDYEISIMDFNNTIVLVNVNIVIPDTCTILFVIPKLESTSYLSKLFLYESTSSYNGIIAYPIDESRELSRNTIVGLNQAPGILIASNTISPNVGITENRRCYCTDIKTVVKFTDIKNVSGSVRDSYRRTKLQKSLYEIGNPYTESCEGVIVLNQNPYSNSGTIVPKVVFSKYNEVENEPDDWDTEWGNYYKLDGTSYKKLSTLYEDKPIFNELTVYEKITREMLLATHGLQGGSNSRSVFIGRMPSNQEFPYMSVARGQVPDDSYDAFFYFYNISSTIGYNIYYELRGSTANRPVLTTNDTGILYYNTTRKGFDYWDGENWQLLGKSIGDSSNRPTLTNSDVAFEYFDTTLGKPIYWNGTAWVDGNGEPIGLQVSDTSILIGAAADSSATISVYHANALNVSALNPDNTPATWLTVPSTIAVGINTLTVSATPNATAPEWATDTYYSKIGNSYNLLTSEPNNWNTNFFDYYTKTEVYSPVEGAEAPVWADDTYFSKSGDYYILLESEPDTWPTTYGDYYTLSVTYSEVEGVAVTTPRGAKVIIEDGTDVVIVNVVQNYV